MRLFGFDIKRATDDQDQPKSFVDPVNDDGALTVGTALGGSYGTIIDLDGTAKSEAELVSKYRSMALQPEVQQAIDEIVNEAINVDTNERVVGVVLDDTKLSNKLKDKIIEEFDEILRMLDFSNQAYEIFQRWYVDGRINYHAVIDEKNIKKGLVELRYIDPRKIRLIREIDQERMDPKTGINLKRIKNEYYMYSEMGFNFGGSSSSATNGLRIAKDAIVRATSGIMNENNTLVLSHLHGAIKPMNQLRLLEDATIIYTLTRAPERRIFYIDVGNLPKAKAEQYLADMMARHKNKLNYNPDTGEVNDARRFMTMTEDFWFPRRDGSRLTEIDTLPAGQGLGDNENLTYFHRKLNKALKVPVSRLEPEATYTFGRVSEISRDEVKFSKFIRRLRTRFSILFDSCLEKQLLLKGIMSPEEWDDIRDLVRYDFMRDNYFEELKQMEILREKMGTLREVEEQTGKYFSRAWVKRNVLFMSKDEAREIKEEIEQERADGEYDDPNTEGGGGYGYDGGGGYPDQQQQQQQPYPGQDEPPQDGEDEPPQDDNDGQEVPSEGGEDEAPPREESRLLRETPLKLNKIKKYRRPK
ncbi:MAG: portal protein [Anaerolineaceae bacterium]